MDFRSFVFRFVHPFLVAKYCYNICGVNCFEKQTEYRLIELCSIDICTEQKGILGIMNAYP